MKWRYATKYIEGEPTIVIDSLDINIAHLRGAIMPKDKSNAILELNEAYEHWDNIGK